MTFTFNYNQKQLERACEEFTEISLRVDNEYCKGWDMKRFDRFNIGITKYGDNDYRMELCDDNGMVRDTLRVNWKNNDITIQEAYYQGKNLKADRYLKQFEQTAMRIFALVKCGKID